MNIACSVSLCLPTNTVFFCFSLPRCVALTHCRSLPTASLRFLHLNAPFGLFHTLSLSTFYFPLCALYCLSVSSSRAISFRLLPSLYAPLTRVFSLFCRLSLPLSHTFSLWLSLPFCVFLTHCPPRFSLSFSVPLTYHSLGLLLSLLVSFIHVHLSPAFTHFVFRTYCRFVALSLTHCLSISLCVPSLLSHTHVHKSHTRTHRDPTFPAQSVPPVSVLLCVLSH